MSVYKKLKEAKNLRLKKSGLADSHKESFRSVYDSKIGEFRFLIKKSDRFFWVPESEFYHIGEIAYLKKSSQDERHEQRELAVKPNSHKLRILRDRIMDAGGLLGKKDAEKEGYDLKSLGLNTALDSKGNLTAHEVQKKINELPEHKFSVTESVYGNQSERGWHDDLRGHLDLHDLPDRLQDAYQEYIREKADKFTENDDYRNHSAVSDHDIIQNHGLMRVHPELMDDFLKFSKAAGIPESQVSSRDEQQIDHWLENSDKAQKIVNDARREIEDQDGNDRYEEALHQAEDDSPIHEFVREQLDSPEDISDYLKGGKSHPDYEKYLNMLAGNEDIRDARDEQRHSTEASDVFQLNAHPDTLKEIESAGLKPAYDVIQKASQFSGHPSGENGLGWVRYTKSPDGIHVDEIQSDLGSNLRSQLASIKEKIGTGEISPDAPVGNGMTAKELIERVPEESLKKLQNILFKGHHPSQLLMDSFLEHQRQTGNKDQKVHIWDANPKAKLSNQKIYNPLEGEELMDWKKVPEDKKRAAIDNAKKQQISHANKVHESNLRELGYRSAEKLYYNLTASGVDPKEASNNRAEYEKFADESIKAASEDKPIPEWPVHKEHIATAHAIFDGIENDVSSLNDKRDFGLRRIEQKYDPNVLDKNFEGQDAVVDKETKTPIFDVNYNLKYAKKLPVHMTETYQKIPKAAGFKPAKYGELETQSAKDLEGQKTWSEKVRKSLFATLKDIKNKLK